MSQNQSQAYHSWNIINIQKMQKTSPMIQLTLKGHSYPLIINSKK